MKKALLIIDVQKDYFKGGRMELSGSNEAADNIQAVLKYFRNENLPVIHIRHISTDVSAGFFLPDTDGIEIDSRLTPQEKEKVITKHFPNSFRETDLLDYLKQNGIEQLVVTGMMTHVCIDATVKAGKDFGFDCIVISDATATKSLEVQGKKVDAEDVQTSLLGALGFFYATLMTTEQFLDIDKQKR